MAGIPPDKYIEAGQSRPLHSLGETAYAKMRAAAKADPAAFFGAAAENEVDGLGDTSTLADPAVVDDLVKNRAEEIL